MASIGPDLPAHLLAKRKREAEAEAQSDSPSTTRSQSPPSSQSPKGDKRRRIAGPSLPPIVSLHNDRSDAVQSPPPVRKVLGPSMPPAPLQERPTSAAGQKDESDSDSDDDYGPSLPSASTEPQINTASAQPHATQISSSSTHNDTTPPTKPARPSWMTAPPTASELRLNNSDPSRHRARGFNTSNRPSSAAQPGGTASSWTETPEQKRARLQRAVLGIADEGSSSSTSANASVSASNGAGDAVGTHRERKEDAETKKRIQEYNAKYRGASLLEQHQSSAGKNGDGKGRGAEEEDDPSKRGFDWEKDMNSGNKMSAASKREMMNRASQMGSRFAGGGYL